MGGKGLNHNDTLGGKRLTCQWERRGVNQRARGIQSVLFQCCASVEDGGPTSKQHWVNSSCLLNMTRQFIHEVLCSPIELWNQA